MLMRGTMLNPLIAPCCLLLVLSLGACSNTSGVTERAIAGGLLGAGIGAAVGAAAGAGVGVPIGIGAGAAVGAIAGVATAPPPAP